MFPSPANPFLFHGIICEWSRFYQSSVPVPIGQDFKWQNHSHAYCSSGNLQNCRLRKGQIPRSYGDGNSSLSGGHTSFRAAKHFVPWRMIIPVLYLNLRIYSSFEDGFNTMMTIETCVAPSDVLCSWGSLSMWVIILCSFQYFICQGWLKWTAAQLSCRNVLIFHKNQSCDEKRCVHCTTETFMFVKVISLKIQVYFYSNIPVSSSSKKILSFAVSNECINLVDLGGCGKMGVVTTEYSWHHVEYKLKAKGSRPSPSNTCVWSACNRY